MLFEDEKLPKKIRKKPRPLFILLDFLILCMAITGLYLILRPVYIHWQQDRLTSKLVDAYEKGLDTITIDPNAWEVDGEEIDYLAETESIAQNTDTESQPAESQPVETTAVPDVIEVKAIGRMIIDKIDLNMPIAEGSTKYNLRVAIGHYSNSVPAGQTGLSIYLGHRMYTYGRHFNRLYEMEVGDTVVIEDKVNRYTYEVDGKEIIDPADLIKAFQEPADESRILLVTCHPVRVASHRLLIKARLVSTEPLG